MRRRAEKGLKMRTWLSALVFPGQTLSRGEGQGGGLCSWKKHYSSGGGWSWWDQLRSRGDTSQKSSPNHKLTQEKKNWMKTLFCVHEAANKKKINIKPFVLLQKKKNKLRPSLEVQRTRKECVRDDNRVPCCFPDCSDYIWWQPKKFSETCWGWLRTRLSLNAPGTQRPLNESQSILHPHQGVNFAAFRKEKKRWQTPPPPWLYLYHIQEHKRSSV